MSDLLDFDFLSELPEDVFMSLWTRGDQDRFLDEVFAFLGGTKTDGRWHVSYGNFRVRI